jgi:hypothetical protein
MFKLSSEKEFARMIRKKEYKIIIINNKFQYLMTHDLNYFVLEKYIDRIYICMNES